MRIIVYLSIVFSAFLITSCASTKYDKYYSVLEGNKIETVNKSMWGQVDFSLDSLALSDSDTVTKNNVSLRISIENKCIHLLMKNNISITLNLEKTRLIINKVEYVLKELDKNNYNPTYTSIGYMYLGDCNYTVNNYEKSKYGYHPELTNKEKYPSILFSKEDSPLHIEVRFVYSTNKGDEHTINAELYQTGLIKKTNCREYDRLTPDKSIPYAFCTQYEKGTIFGAPEFFNAVGTGIKTIVLFPIYGIAYLIMGDKFGD